MSGECVYKITPNLCTLIFNLFFQTAEFPLLHSGKINSTHICHQLYKYKTCLHFNFQIKNCSVLLYSLHKANDLEDIMNDLISIALRSPLNVWCHIKLYFFSPPISPLLCSSALLLSATVISCHLQQEAEVKRSLQTTESSVKAR